MILNKHNLAVESHAAKSALRPILTAISVTDKVTVAAGAYRLLEVELPKVEDKDLPSCFPTGKHKSFLLPTAAALKASKNIPKNTSLPILQNVATSINEEGNMVTLSTSDLETTDRVEARIIDGNYPDYEQIIPKDLPRASITLNADYVKDMADFFYKHGKDEIPTIQLKLYGHDKPCIMTGKTKEGQGIRGLIMPMRKENNTECHPVYDNAWNLLLSLESLVLLSTHEFNTAHGNDEIAAMNCAWCRAKKLVDLIKPPFTPEA